MTDHPDLTDLAADEPRHRGRRRHRDRRRARRPLRARRAALPRPALRRGDADDPQPGRRRGPRAGDLREGLRVVPPVPARHQPQGLALPDPDQHLHQQLPQEAAPAAAVDVRGRRGLAARPRRVAHLDRAEVRGDGGARAPARLRRSRTRCSGCPRSSASRSTSPTSRGSPTRRSPRSWGRRSAP